jgi:ABC transport system ATP-binding/permease protein
VANPATEISRAAPQLLVRMRRSDRVLLAGIDYRIGRDPSADIVVADPRVSWWHAVLRADGATWVLEDSGSTNGTFLGPERMSRLVISTSFVVRLGNADDGPLLRVEPQFAGAPGPRVVPAPRAEAAHRSDPPPGRPEKSALGESQLMPSVDRRPTARTPLLVQAMRIGRTPDNELVIEDLSVSRRHAELRKSLGGGYEIIDLGSHNGTFVNGARVDQAELAEADIVAIGHATFRLAGGELREYVDTGDVSLEARDLRVQVGGGKVLLDRVSFPIPERCLLGVIGPSGAGKSTLLGALTGMRPADSGTVLYDNRDLYSHYAELRHRIGLVPQDNIMHAQLTARRALSYAAELRFPGDTSKHERTRRVCEVMEELGLTRHADTRADRLSGGQRKRVNVALELLTKPSLLFLDEPTSGLDPGLDKSVMEQMRDLAHDGRTVVVVTHSVDNLDTCDRLLVLVPGGKIAYYGPPEEGLAYFGKARWAEVFQAFEAEPGRDWAAEFRVSRECAHYVTGPSSQRPTRAARPRGGAPAPPVLPPRRRGRIRQLSTLARRYLRVIAADRGYLLFTALLPIVLGALIRLVPSPEGLGGGTGTNGDAEELLLVLVISACLAGTANSVREFVKERAIYVRERAAGLSAGSYLASKILVLGVISVIQALLVVGIGLGGRRLPPSGSLLTTLPFAELLLAVAVLSFVSMCLGLLVSSLVSTSEKAMPVLVLFTMVQVVLSGAVFPLAGMAGLSQLSWLSPSRWGMGALASTTRLNVLNPVMGNNPDPLWQHTPHIWLMDMGLQIALGLVFILVARRRLGRPSPGQRR